MTTPHIRRAGLALAALAACAASAGAQTSVQRTEIHLIVEPSSVETGVEKTAAKGEPLLVTEARSPRAVRLDADVTVGGLNSSAIPAGTVLFGRYDDSAWSYCVNVKPNGGYQALDAVVAGVFTAGLSLLEGSPRYMRCFHDADGDGVFDSAWTGPETRDKTAFLAYSLSEISLAEPVPYTRLPYTDGPAMPVEFAWTKQKKTNTLSVGAVIGGLDMNTTTVAVPAPGAEPTSFSRIGATVEILGYDAETQSVRYRVVDNSTRQYVNVPATLTTTTSYVYY